MAAILILFVILVLLLAGRTQALAADYGSEPLLRFQVWQLALAVLVPLIFAVEVSTIAKAIAVIAAAAAFVVSAVRARHVHDADDLHF